MMTTFAFKPKLLSTLRHYNKQQFTTDLLAGIIVGIVALPLAIAFGIASSSCLLIPIYFLVTSILLCPRYTDMFAIFMLSMLNQCDAAV